MTVLDKIGGTLGSFGWDSMGNILVVVMIVIALIVVFGIIAVFMWYKTFNIQVKLYEPKGQVPLSEEELVKIKAKAAKGDVLEELKKRNLKFSLLKVRRTRGKYVTVKGDPYFMTLLPFKKHEPVQTTMMYDDGIHMVRIAKTVFIPIRKPDMTLELDKSVSISISDDNRWRVWNNMMADRINNKYQDIDAQKRVAFYFITGIVALVLVGGFILWLIYSSANKGMDTVDKFSEATRNLMGGNAPK